MGTRTRTPGISSSYETILDGDLEDNDLWGILNVDDNSYHVVTGPMGEPPAVLDGLTVTAGRADGDYPNHYGGGLYNPGGKLDIVNCTFRGNTAVWGGGIMNFGAPIRLVNTQLIGNRALMLGGGLYNYGGDATLHNCRIVGNTADYADVAGGAAIYNLDGTLADSQLHRRGQPAPRAAGRSPASVGARPPARRSRSPTASCTTAATRSGATTFRPSKSPTATSRAAGPAPAISASIRSSSRPASAASRASGSTAITGSKPPPRPSTPAATPHSRRISSTSTPTATWPSSFPATWTARLANRGHARRYGRLRADLPRSRPLPISI